MTDFLPPRWVVICWAGFVLTFLTLMAVTEYTNTSIDSQLETVLMGVALGEFGLATIVGGLIARSWIAGWLFVVFLACFQTAAGTLAVELFRWNTRDAQEQIAICSMCPILLLSTCAPLVALRGVWGWTLSREPTDANPRWRLSVEDLVLAGVIVACSITISQLFFYTQGSGGIAEVLFTMGVFVAMGLVCVPPVVYVTFRCQRWFHRLIGWTLLSALAFLMTFLLAAALDQDWQSAIDMVPDMLIGVPAGCLTVAVGLTALLKSGYQLTHFASRSVETETQVAAADEPVKSNANDTWLSDGDQQPTATRPRDIGRWQARIATAIVVLMAATGGFVVQFGKQQNLMLYRWIESSDLRAVYTHDGEVYGMHFGPEFTDADITKYLRFKDSITILSFADTQVTDAILPTLNSFSKLVELDLSRTAVTDAGLQSLELTSRGRYDEQTSSTHFSSLAYLGLADTKVTWVACAQLAARLNILNMDLSGLRITDEQLEYPISVQGLKLARNPITDAGIQQLLEIHPLVRLDVTDTSITGSCINSQNCPKTLILDGTQISDATLLPILAAGELQVLSLMNTQVTAAILPELGGLSVRLGKGAITDDDLGRLPSIEFKHLGLNDRQFTGKCLVNGNLLTNSLDLGNSSVNDSTLSALSQALNAFRFLGLANTKITNAGLRHVRANELDIRGSQVTAAAGIHQLSPNDRIVITRHQFTPEQKAAYTLNSFRIDERVSMSNGPR